MHDPSRRHITLGVGFSLLLGASAVAAGCFQDAPDHPLSSTLPPAASSGDSPPFDGRGSPPPFIPDGGSTFQNGDAASGALGPQPIFGPTVTQATPPPPISGGTLLITADGKTAVAADPDRDLVYLVDVASQRLTATVALAPGDEPGRVVEDGAHRVHVALRGAGQLATIDLATATVTARRAVCSAPRGVAYDVAIDSVYVACSGGELVTFPAAGGAPTRSVVIERDLRDVVLLKGVLYVSRFRSAELLRLAADGTVAAGMAPVSRTGGTPSVAWRTVALPDGSGIAMVHQAAHVANVSPAPGGYGGGGGCSAGIVESVVTLFGPSQVVGEASLPTMVLPVDIAVAPSVTSMTGAFAVAAAGNAHNGFEFGLVQSTLEHIGATFTPDAGSFDAEGFDGGGIPSCIPPDFGARSDVSAQPIAVAIDASGNTMVLTREPATLRFVSAKAASNDAVLPLSSISREDTGHTIFHANAGNFVACASCHAEGADDGRVWDFIGLGSRRTPSLRGTVAGTAPYHWDGAMTDFTMLVHEVFQGRMSGPALRDDQRGALSSWVNAIPAPPVLGHADAATLARGKTLFENDGGCIGCHNGPKLTNNATVDVGTGGAFQVPPLVGVGWRAPFLHNGCAATLDDRFGVCATSKHGRTEHLSTTQVADLVAYLESL